MDYNQPPHNSPDSSAIRLPPVHLEGEMSINVHIKSLKVFFFLKTEPSAIPAVSLISPHWTLFSWTFPQVSTSRRRLTSVGGSLQVSALSLSSPPSPLPLCSSLFIIPHAKDHSPR